VQSHLSQKHANLPKALIQLRRLHGDPTDGGDPTARLHVSIRFYHHKLNARKGFSFSRALDE
jgi:hypothetical protein